MQIGEKDTREFRDLLDEIIRSQLSLETFEWLMEKGAEIAREDNSTQLRAAFARVPRKTGRQLILIKPEVNNRITGNYGGFSLDGWPADRLSRLRLLLQVPDSGKESYFRKIDGLFRDAEMNELVALYSSLYFYHYPELWTFRTTEGVRSNIGGVLEAVMYENPYPGNYLDEPAWNQMIMKAFFTDKDVRRIIGLDQRANKKLASMLTDYAQERWAAHRTVNPQLWMLVSAFIGEENFSNIIRLFEKGGQVEKQSGALACSGSDYQPAKDLLERNQALNNAIKENKLNWNTVSTL